MHWITGLHRRKIKQLFEQIEAHYKNAEKAYDEIINDLDEKEKQEKNRLQQKRDKELKQAQDTLNRKIQKAQEDAESVATSLGIHASDWSDKRWKSFTPTLYQPNQVSDFSHIPYILRLGEVMLDVHKSVNPALALAPFIGTGHIIILSNNSTRSLALHLLQNLLTRILILAPARSIRATTLDPLGMGSNFPFKRLPEYIRGQTVYIERDEIQDQIRDLSEHLRQVTTTYLSRDYDSIEKYNEDAGAIVEPYRLLAIADFPTHFDHDTITRLISITQQGVKTGIYTIIHANTDVQLPYDINIQSLYETSTVIHVMDQNTCRVRMGTDIHNFRPDKLLNSALFNEILNKVSIVAEEGSFSGIDIENIELEQDDWWQKLAIDLVEVPIGLSGARDPLLFWVGERKSKNAVHTLIGGRTQSGKSTMLNVMINSIVTTYSPDEVELYLIDFKEGVEFKPYADYNLPHARVIGIESEPEFGLSVLKSIRSQLQRRGRLFKEVSAKSFKSYRVKTQKKLPRIIVIIDEFQIMFNESNQVSEKISVLVEDIARRGGAFGIHLIFSSQSIRVPDLRSVVYDQFSTRIVLQASEDEIAALLSPENIAASKTLERPGEVIYNDGGGERGFNTPGQIALIKDAEIINNLTAIQERASQQIFENERSVYVFQGNTDAQITDNNFLKQLYGFKTWPTHTYLKDTLKLQDWAATEFPLLLWLGEAVEIKPHTSIILRRRSRANVLLVGSNEASIVGMFGGMLLSTLGQLNPSQVILRIIDITLLETSWEDIFSGFAKYFSNYDINVVKRRRAKQMIETLYKELEQRIERFNAGEEINDPAILLMFVGGHKLSDLRPTQGRYSDPSELAMKLERIMQSGPEVGIHLIMWYDRVSTFNAHFERHALSYFAQRIAMKTSEDESREIINNSTATNLKEHRALLYNEENSEELEKFKPYAFPESKKQVFHMLHKFAQQLLKRKDT